MHFGFTQMKLRRISAWCVVENAESVHVLEKLGMQLKGRVGEHQYFKGRRWDILSYAISYEEWQARN